MNSYKSELIKLLKNKEAKISILGLGYVGLPLAVEFSKKYNVIGFDLDEVRVSELNDELVT